MNLHANSGTESAFMLGDGSFSLSQGASSPTAVWYDSANLCALADTERHLGHTVRAGERWIAYDATHPNQAGDGFLILGNFDTLTSAKLAIELSLGQRGCWWRRGNPWEQPC